MEWIHCNACFKQPRSRDPDFVLTSCGHIFCKSCESRESVDHCLVCNASCMVTKLSSSMKPEVRAYFEDVEPKLKSLYDTLRFQKNHRLNLFKRHARMCEQFRNMKAENHHLRKQLMKMGKKLEFYEKRRSQQLQSPAPVDNFHFTPRTINHPVNTPTAPSTITSQSTVNTDPRIFPFVQPDIDSYHRYRNAVHATPDGSSDSTPDRFARQFVGNRVNYPPYNAPRNQANLPHKTPPYDDLRRMNIGERRNRQ